MQKKPFLFNAQQGFKLCIHCLKLDRKVCPFLKLADNNLSLAVQFTLKVALSRAVVTLDHFLLCNVGWPARLQTCYNLFFLTRGAKSPRWLFDCSARFWREHSTFIPTPTRESADDMITEATTKPLQVCEVGKHRVLSGDNEYTEGHFTPGFHWHVSHGHQL